MIMIILENICMEIFSRWYIDSVIKTKKTIQVHKPLAICGNVFCSDWITRKGWKNILVKSVKINNYSCLKERKEEDSSSYKGHRLFLSEDRFEVVRINCGIDSIPLFRINILLPSESVWFGVKMTRMEPDDKVELREVLNYYTCL